MKPIFCINTTTDRKNTDFDGKELITRCAGEENTKIFKSKRDTFVNVLKKVNTPLAMQMVKWFCGLLAVLVLVPTLAVGTDAAMKNAPVLVIGGAVAALAWVVLMLVSRIRQRQMLMKYDLEGLSREVYHAYEAVQRELDIPSNASKVDVLTFQYEYKNGKVIPKTYGLQATPFLNTDVKMFVSGDALCINDVENVYTVPISEIKGITEVGSRISLPMWNKEESPKSEKYRAYKLTPNTLGGVSFKPYYIMEIEHEGELYGLYLPSYEIDEIKKLIGYI